MGSKNRIAKHIVPIIQNFIDNSDCDYYVEPFVGGANVIDKINYKNKIGCDVNKYLIFLLRFVQDGGTLPEDVSRETYESVREKPENFSLWFVGCVRFLASYNGKFFNGYAGIVNTKQGTVRNYYDEAKRNLLKQAINFNDIDFCCVDYRNLYLRNCVVYCDPPYISTTGYNNSKFNHDEFWNKVRQWSQDNIVFVSEQVAPEDFNCIWEGSVTRTQDNASRKPAVEKLFVLKDIKYN